MKTWVKNGIIGGIIGLLGSLIAIILGTLGIPTLWLLPFAIVGVLFSLSGTLGCNFKMDNCYPEAILGIIVTTIIFFFIGALIGLIIQKRNKKKNKLENRKR